MADKSGGQTEVPTSDAEIAGNAAAELAAYNALEKEIDAEDGGAPADEAAAEAPDTKLEPEQPKDEKDKAQQARLTYEELEKRHKDLQGALGQERATRKAEAERRANMETVLRQVVAERQQRAQQAQQQTAEPEPTLETDPAGFFQRKLAEQERMINDLRTQSTRSAEEVQQAQFWSYVDRAESAMRASNPDYAPAVSAMEQARMAELSVMVPDEAVEFAQQHGYETPADLRAAILNRDRVSIAQQALAMRRNPAELYFEIAKHRGFVKPAQAKSGATQVIDMARAGQKAAKSIAGGGSTSASADMSAEDLADLYLTDPDQADKVFATMKSKGLLQ